MNRVGAIAFAIGFLIFGGGLPDVAMAQDYGPLNGTWEGDLKSVDLKGDGKTSTFWRRIVIGDGRARVFYKNEERIIEVKPGKFLVERHMTNAVVAAIDSGSDNEGTWVETWIFAVTQKDRNTLIANFTRQVNNVKLPLSVSHSKFSSAATGELTRK